MQDARLPHARFASAAPPLPEPNRPAQPQPPGPVPAPPLEKRPKRWPWGLAAVGLIGAAALAYSLLNSTGGGGVGVGLRTAVAAPGKLQKKIRLGGTVAAKRYAAIRAPRSSGPRESRSAQLTLAKLATPGSTVQPGEVVAEFELQWLEDHIGEVKSQSRQLQAAIDKQVAENMITRETDTQAMRVAKAEKEKADLDLRTAEVKSQIEAEILANLAKEAAATAGELEQEVEVKEGVHEALVRIAEIEAAEGDLHLERHQRDYTKMRIQTPVGGLIVMETIYRGGGQFKQTEEGDQVYPGALFMRVVDLSDMIVTASVNQADVQAIRIGQRAEVRLDAYPEVLLEGRISSIGAIAGQGGSNSRFSRGGSGLYVKSVPVEIEIHTEDERVIPDLSASADVFLSSRDAEVIVPRSAVKSAADGSSIVYVKRGEGFEPRRVELGERSEIQVVVEEGIAAGEEVLLGDPPADDAG